MEQQPDFKSIAAQLRHPEGEDGIKTAVRMSENNAFMITSCIDALVLKANDSILEIGPGGGLHIPYLFRKEEALLYQGVDISETMITMATENNAALLENGSVTLSHVASENGYVTFPFEDNAFDKIFTVNTLYFWDDAPAQAKEIYRVLKPGGQLCIAFAPKDFMETLPFTQYHFHLYTQKEAEDLFAGSGFGNIRTEHKSERLENTVNGTIDRTFSVLSATK